MFKMITKERMLELRKQAGSDEKKYAELLAKEETSLAASELDMVTGGGILGDHGKIKFLCRN